MLDSKTTADFNPINSSSRFCIQEIEKDLSKKMFNTVFFKEDKDWKQFFGTVLETKI